MNRREALQAYLNRALPADGLPGNGEEFVSFYNGIFVNLPFLNGRFGNGFSNHPFGNGGFHNGGFRDGFRNYR